MLSCLEEIFGSRFPGDVVIKAIFNLIYGRKERPECTDWLLLTTSHLSKKDAEEVKEKRKKMAENPSF